MNKKVVIVGGGISGLATAFYVKRARPDLKITLVEGRGRLGGVITTRRQDGFVIEGGPDSFVNIKPWGVQLCRDLGIDGRLIPTDPSNKKVYIYSGGRLQALPPGMILTAPTQIWPFLKNSLISWPGKLRMGMDLVLPRGRECPDESLGSFVGRRLGQEAVDKIAEPILGGIFLADASRLSLKCTFPRFLDMEREHRSLILAMRRQSRRATNGGSMFRAMAGGMDDLVTCLREALEGVELRTGLKAVRVEKPLKVITEEGALEASAVVMAVPPPQCAALLRPVSEAAADEIASIPTLSTATVSLGYSRARPNLDLDGTGFVIPKKEQRRILACTWSSRKFVGRAPEHHLLVRCFVGGERGEEHLKGSDEDLAQLARQELREIMGLQEEPILSRVFRWPEANPVYEVGHQAKVERIESLVDPDLNLYLSGSGFRGVGIPDCVRDAQRVAGAIAERI